MLFAAALHYVAPNTLDVLANQQDMSLWDIHRSQTPWLVLVAPERARDTTNSLVTMFQQGGKLPRWPLGNTIIVMSRNLCVNSGALTGSTFFHPGSQCLHWVHGWQSRCCCHG